MDSSNKEFKSQLISEPIVVEDSSDTDSEIYVNNAEHPVTPPPTTQANNVQNTLNRQPAHPVPPYQMYILMPPPLYVLHPHQYPPQLWYIPSIVPPPPAQYGAQANQISEQPGYYWNGCVYFNTNRRPNMNYGFQSYMPHYPYPGTAVRPRAYGGNYEYLTGNNNFYPVHQGPPAAPTTGSYHMSYYAPHREPSTPNIDRPSFIDGDAALPQNVQQIPTFGHHDYASNYRNEQQRSVNTRNEVQNVSLPIASVPSTYAPPTSASPAMPSNNAAEPSTSDVRRSTSVDVPSTGRHAPLALPPILESSDSELERELLVLERRLELVLKKKPNRHM